MKMDEADNETARTEPENATEETVEESAQDEEEYVHIEWAGFI